MYISWIKIARIKEWMCKCEREENKEQLEGSEESLDTRVRQIKRRRKEPFNIERESENGNVTK